MLENTVSTDQVAMQTLGIITPVPFIPLMGAYPIVIEGEIVGGISVAGAQNGENDEIIAVFAIEQFMNL